MTSMISSNSSDGVIPAVLYNETEPVLLPTTRPPFSDDQNRFLQYFVTFSTMPSWIASALILYVLWQERRVRLWKPANTYHRLILGLSVYDLTWSLHFTYFGGHWTIPAYASDWVVDADATTDFWCQISGVFFYQFWGTVLYSTSLMLYFIMDLQWHWSKEWIAEHLEPWMHVVSNTVPWLHGIIAWLSEAIVPSPKLPGVCYLREWPPDCESDDNPAECIHGSSEGTALSVFLTTVVFGAWVVVIVGAMTTLTGQVWKVERKMRLQQQARRTALDGTTTTSSQQQLDDELPHTKKAAVQGLLYVFSGLVCTLPSVPFNFSFWDLNEEYDHVHFTLALFMAGVTGNQGVFNAYIYLRPYFKELTASRNSTLWFVRPIRQILERSSVCVAFWSCKCCDCFIQSALESPFFRRPATTNVGPVIIRPPPRFSEFTATRPYEDSKEFAALQLQLQQQQQQQQNQQETRTLPPTQSTPSISESHSEVREVVAFIPITSTGTSPLAAIPEQRQRRQLHTVSSISMNGLEDPDQMPESAAGIPKTLYTTPLSKTNNNDSLQVSSLTTSTGGGGDILLLPSTGRGLPAVSPSTARNNKHSEGSGGFFKSWSKNNPSTKLNSHNDDEEVGMRRPTSSARTKDKPDLHGPSVHSDDTPSTSGTLHQEEDEVLHVRVISKGGGGTRVPQQQPVTLKHDEENDGWVQAPIFVREGCFHETIVAPAGPLGVSVRETSDGPVILAVDDYSSIRECIEVGDILIAIDNISTRWMAVQNVVALIRATRVLARRVTVERHESSVMDRQEFEVVFDAEDEEEEEEEEEEDVWKPPILVGQ